MGFFDRYKGFIIIFILTVLLVMIGLTFGGREKVTFAEDALGKVFKAVNTALDYVDEKVSSVVGPIFNIWENERKLEELQKENEELVERLKETTIGEVELAELKDLKKALNYIEDENADVFVAGEIISEDQSNLYTMFTLNLGTENGITVNSAVLNGSGLVGMVYETGSTWSKVITLADSNSSVGFEVLHYSRNFEGLIDGSVDGIMHGMIFDKDAEVVEGDMLITSGKGIFPKGILIGTVTEVIYDTNKFLTEVSVTPRVDFGNLGKVVVIPYRGEENED